MSDVAARRGLSGRVLSILESWRFGPVRLCGLWRRSLQFRTVLITIALSVVALLVTVAYMSQSIASGLYASRIEQVLRESLAATRAAQNTFDAMEDSSNEASVIARFGEVQNALRGAVPNANNRIALLRSAGEQGPSPVQDSVNASINDGTISAELRAEVAAEAKPQYYQPVTLHLAEGDTPAVAVGTTLYIPLLGQYEFYAVFALANEQDTLAFVQSTLLLGGLALVGLIGGVAWVIVRLVVRPITVTAETSRRLAEGELEVRMPQTGTDEFATLARSFNGMAQSLQDQIVRLGELSQVQQRFVSDVSHELRTPLTTIRLAGDVLYDQRERLDPTTARAAELLHTQVERLESMLTDLLEISRHDAGAVQLDREASSLVRLVEHVIDSSRAVAVESGSDLHLVAPGGYAQAEFDPRRVRRIVRNLIDNAIEHGEGRPIVITVDSSETAVAVSVRDYGIGISAENQERVFERFWRADPSRKRTLGGTGLGLAISIEDASLHGGWLNLWSELGQGSYFVLTLPRAAGERLIASPLPLVPDDVEVPR